MGEIKTFNKKRVAILLIMINLFNEIDPLSRISGGGDLNIVEKLSKQF